jgi:hypothetical protein
MPSEYPISALYITLEKKRKETMVVFRPCKALGNRPLGELGSCYRL